MQCKIKGQGKGDRPAGRVRDTLGTQLYQNEDGQGRGFGRTSLFVSFKKAVSWEPLLEESTKEKTKVWTR